MVRVRKIMAVRKTEKGLALKRWFKEKWRTPRGKKGYSGKDRTFRPTVRVSKKLQLRGANLANQKELELLKKKEKRVESLGIR